eukprot:3721575-Amphidinium_carterae.1
MARLYKSKRLQREPAHTSAEAETDAANVSHVDSMSFERLNSPTSQTLSKLSRCAVFFSHHVEQPT